MRLSSALRDMNQGLLQPNSPTLTEGFIYLSFGIVI